MNNKFYIQLIIRDDGERFVFDEKEIYLAKDNTLLVRPEIASTEVDYTDMDGGEMIRQRLPSHTQDLRGIIYPRDSEYWDLYFKLTSFFKINHYYKLIYVKKNGEFFAQQNAWMTRNLQVSPNAREETTEWTVGLKLQSSALFEYAEDDEGNEVYANRVTLPLLSAAAGGEDWNGIGQIWDAVGSVWSAGDGGIQEVSIQSISTVYPRWTVKGVAMNPVLQNNSTDTVSVYNGTIAANQTLIVDFATGIATLDGAIVSRNVTGQVSFKPGLNLAGFNVDGGTVTESTIEWNNVIG